MKSRFFTRKKIISIVLISLVTGNVVGCTPLNGETTKSSEEYSSIEEVFSEADSKEEDTASVEIGTIQRYPEPSTDAYYENPRLTELPEFDEFQGYKVSEYTDLSKLDLKNEYEKLCLATFDNTTIWPDSLPENFKPEEIMKFNKTPGLGIHELHEQGIDGTGVNMAIIDQTLLVNHVEYVQQIKHYEEIGDCRNWPAQMHGAAVTSVLAGKNVGVASGCGIYYIATDNAMENIVKAIWRIKEINDSLPEDAKIKAISFSNGKSKEDEGYQEYIEAVKAVEADGIAFLSSSGPHKTMFNKVTSDATLSATEPENYLFNELSRKPMLDPEDFNSYTNEYKYYTYDTKTLCAPMESRVLASQTGRDNYRFDPLGGTSWVTPYFAGVYALACQVDKELTFEEFWKVAQDTAVVIKDEEGSNSGNVINPAGIVKALQEKTES